MERKKDFCYSKARIYPSGIRNINFRLTCRKYALKEKILLTNGNIPVCLE